ncbi:MAG: hypothetical protein RL140_711 [Actinomycetota bacterium]
MGEVVPAASLKLVSVRKTSGGPGFRATALAAILSFALTGCADLPSPDPITPVDYRACLLTETSPDALGVNEVADYAMKQAVATYGVKRTVLRSSPAKFLVSVEKLHTQGCNLIVLTGDDFAPQVDEIVMTRPETNFLYITETAQPELIRADRDNLALYQLDLYEAGVLAGHLAASMAELNTVAVLCELPEKRQFVAGIRAGILKFNEDFPYQTQFAVGAKAAADSSVRIAVGCDGELAVGSSDANQSVRFIGYGLDLYLNPMVGEYKKNVAATVIPNVRPRILEVIASDLEGDFIGGSLGSVFAKYGNNGLVISQEREIAFPAGELEELARISRDYETTLK